MSYTFKTYQIHGQTFFVYGEQRLTTKSVPVSDDLMQLLDLDPAELEEICSRICRSLLRLHQEKNSRLVKPICLDLMALSKMHVYFSFLRLDWQDRLKRSRENGFADASDTLPIKQISYIPGNISEMQRQIREILKRTLDIDATRGHHDSASERLYHYYRKVKQDPTYNSALELFPFEALPLCYEMTEQNAFAEVLYPRSIYDLINYSLRKTIMENQPWRVCKYCERYFPIHGRTSAEYCDRPITESGSTCKDVGSTKTWETKMTSDESFQMYRREYKRRFAWIRLNRWAPEQFSAWSAQAQQKRAACSRGEISPEEFAAWLKE